MDQQGSGLADGFDVDPVYVDVRGQGDSPPDTLGDVFGGERPDSPVRCFGLLLVAVEAHEAELGLGQPGQHLQDPHVLSEELQAQTLGYGVRPDLAAL
jgi:hypothetical protein